MMPLPVDAMHGAHVLFWMLSAVVIAGTIADTLESLRGRPR